MNARPAVVRPLASSASAARDASAPTRAARPRLAAAAPRKPRLSVKRRAAKPVCPGLIRVHGSYVPSMSGHTNVTELRSTAPKHCSGETPVSASSARAGHGCETRRPSPPAPLVPVRAVGGPPAPAAQGAGAPALDGTPCRHRATRPRPLSLTRGQHRHAGLVTPGGPGENPRGHGGHVHAPH